MRCYRSQMGKLRLREARDSFENSQSLEFPETKSGGREWVGGGSLSLDVWGRACNPGERMPESGDQAEQTGGAGGADERSAA